MRVGQSANDVAELGAEPSDEFRMATFDIISATLKIVAHKHEAFFVPPVSCQHALESKFQTMRDKRENGSAAFIVRPAGAETSRR